MVFVRTVCADRFSCVSFSLVLCTGLCIRIRGLDLLDCLQMFTDCCWTLLLHYSSNFTASVDNNDDDVDGNDSIIIVIIITYRTATL